MNETIQKKKSSVFHEIYSSIGGDKLILMGAIVVVFILFTSINSNFFSINNIINLMVGASLIGLVAIGQIGRAHV